MSLATRFQPGGTVREDAVYVERGADRELFTALSAGELCYVLAPRQIGKSSLRVRVARQLREGGARVATVDLTRIGAHDSTADGWYFGIVQELSSRLGLAGDPALFWKASGDATPVHRFARFLREQVLSQVSERVVIFIDEIDTVLALPFSSDDFFAAIREAFNLRAEEPAYARLSFCLMGVATPMELVRDPSRTPFNVGRAISLQDFTASEAAALLPALGEERVLRRVLEWTHGHPYMTMRTCDELVRRKPAEPLAEVDAIVAETFLAAGRVEDSNLAYAERRLLADPRAAALLRLYRRLLDGSAVPADRDDDVQAALRLTGMAANDAGGLRVRNRVFARVFDADWVRQQEAARVLAEPLRAWLSRGRPDDLVLRGQALQEARAWALGRRDLSPEESEFLLAGLEVARREQEERARAERAEADARGLRRLLGVGGVLFALLLAALGGALFEYRRAETERLRALGSLASALARQPGREGDAVRAGVQATAPALQAGRAAAVESASGLMAALAVTGHFPTLALPGQARIDFRTSGDGKTLEILLVNGDALFFDLEDPAPPRTYIVSDGILHAISFSPDGRLLAGSDTACDGAVFEVATGSLVQRVKACALAFGPSGQLCLQRPDGVITAGALELRGLDKPGPIGPREQLATNCSFSAGSVLGHEGQKLIVWDARTGAAQFAFAPGQPVVHALFSPDGASVLVVLLDHSLHVLDARDGHELRKASVERPPTVFVGAAFSPDGKRVLLGDWTKLEVRDFQTLQPVATRAPPRGLLGAVFASDELVAVEDTDGYVRFFDSALQRDSQLSIAAHAADGRGLAIAPGGHALASGGNDGKLRWFAPGLQAPRLVLHGLGPVTPALSFDGSRFLASKAKGGALLADTRSGKALLELPGDDAMGFSLSADGRTVAVVRDSGAAEVFDERGARLLRVQLQGGGQRAFQLSPQGDELLAGEAASLRRFAVPSGHELPALGPLPHAPTLAVWSADGKQVATLLEDGEARLHDRASARELRVLRGFPSRGSALAITGERVYAESPLKGLWSWRDGEPELGLAFLPAYAAGLAAARSEALLVSGLLLQRIPAAPPELLRAGCAFLSGRGALPPECN